MTTDHGIRRQPQRVSQNPGTHFSLFLLCNSKCISPLITRINHSSQHKSSPTHLSLPAHPGHDESAEAPSGDKAGWSPHLSDVLSSGEGRGQVPPDRVLAPSPAFLTPILTGLPPVRHRHCGNPGCKARAAALGMLSFLSPSLSTRGNHCLGATVPACICTHIPLFWG